MASGEPVGASKPDRADLLRITDPEQLERIRLAAIEAYARVGHQAWARYGHIEMSELLSNLVVVGIYDEFLEPDPRYGTDEDLDTLDVPYRTIVVDGELGKVSEAQGVLPSTWMIAFASSLMPGAGASYRVASIYVDTVSAAESQFASRRETAAIQAAYYRASRVTATELVWIGALAVGGIAVLALLGMLGIATVEGIGYVVALAVFGLVAVFAVAARLTGLWSALARLLRRE